MRTIYSSNLVLIFSSNVEMAADVLKIEEVTFTLVTNKKYKRKGKVFFFLLCFDLILEVRHHLSHELFPFSML